METTGKTADMVRIVVAYVVALFIGGVSLRVFDYGPLPDLLLADVVATVVIFGFSRAYGNCSFYDAYWSVLPPFMALFWLAVGSSEVSTLREMLVLGLILYWATRLTLNWAVYWEGMHHEDWRYPMLRERAPRMALLVDFFGIHLIPTLQVFAGMLPVYALYVLGDRPFNWLDLLAAAVTGAAITLQLVADRQLHRFIARRREGEQLHSGLWAWSRHPNYCGELGFWLGLYLFGLAAYPAGWWWMALGIVMMTLMFLFASIPMMEQRSLERRPDYQRVINSTSMLIPWPPRGQRPPGGGEQSPSG
jgi:steroid 5-alpha reductase family enzyme